MTHPRHLTLTLALALAWQSAEPGVFLTFAARVYTATVGSVAQVLPHQSQHPRGTAACTHIRHEKA
jgi:hypothetical protein